MLQASCTKVHHRRRQGFAQQRLIQRLLDPTPGQFGFRSPLFGIAQALFKQFAAPTLVTGEREEVGQQFGENRRIIDKISQQALHHLFDAQIQAVARFAIAIAPAHGGRRQFH